jgi:hypothetical protein
MPVGIIFLDARLSGSPRAAPSTACRAALLLAALPRAHPGSTTCHDGTPRVEPLEPPRRRPRAVVRPSRRAALSSGERVATTAVAKPRRRRAIPACRSFEEFRRTPCVRPSPNLVGATHTDPHTRLATRATEDPAAARRANPRRDQGSIMDFASENP